MFLKFITVESELELFENKRLCILWWNTLALRGTAAFLPMCIRNCEPVGH